MDLVAGFSALPLPTKRICWLAVQPGPAQRPKILVWTAAAALDWPILWQSGRCVGVHLTPSMLYVCLACVLKHLPVGVGAERRR